MKTVQDVFRNHFPSLFKWSISFKDMKRTKRIEQKLYTIDPGTE